MQQFSELQYQGNVCISGLTASGKTTHSHLLAGEFGLTYVSGSQIQLNFLGVSPIQSRDFWITVDAKRLWNEPDFRKIDSELLRIESEWHGCVFDTSTMPWRHECPALCIWLESSIESRVLKSIISHRGRGQFTRDEYSEKISEKDEATRSLYRSLYEIDIGQDLTPFDLVLDLSELIRKPSLEASLESINTAHSIIRPAVGWYLTGRREFQAEFEVAARRLPHIIVSNRVSAARVS